MTTIPVNRILLDIHKIFFDTLAGETGMVIGPQTFFLPVAVDIQITKQTENAVIAKVAEKLKAREQEQQQQDARKRPATTATETPILKKSRMAVPLPIKPATASKQPAAEALILLSKS
jgi:hypothetical protein